MAVIRAKRLWVLTLAGARDVPVELPTLGDIPETYFTQADLYTVPAGKRAIVRTSSTTLGGVPPGGTEPTSYLILRRAGGFEDAIRWAWYVDHHSGVANWVLNDVWNGQIVMHAGDTMVGRNLTGVPLTFHGSGHELPELSS